MTKTIKQALALKNGEFQDGIYLCLSDDLMIDQTSWDDSDLAKGIDFNIYPYWVIGNDVTPQGIYADISALNDFGRVSGDNRRSHKPFTFDEIADLLEYEYIYEVLS